MERKEQRNKEWKIKKGSKRENKVEREYRLKNEGGHCPLVGQVHFQTTSCIIYTRLTHTASFQTTDTRFFLTISPFSLHLSLSVTHLHACFTPQAATRVHACQLKGFRLCAAKKDQKLKQRNCRLSPEGTDYFNQLKHNVTKDHTIFIAMTTIPVGFHALQLQINCI